MITTSFLTPSSYNSILPEFVENFNNKTFFNMIKAWGSIRESRDRQKFGNLVVVGVDGRAEKKERQRLGYRQGGVWKSLSLTPPGNNHC
jgi:hypothetical protein